MAFTYGIGLTMRGVLAAIVVGAGIVTVVVGCASSSENASALAGDSGAPDGGEGGLGNDAGDSGVAVGTTLLVHASPDLYDFRICFGSSPSSDLTTVDFVQGAPPWPYDDTHPMAMSNYAAVAVGAGVGVPHEILPDDVFIVPYLINASTLATKADPRAVCASRVGPACGGGANCITGSDVTQLPAIPSAMLTQGGGTHVLAIVGCKTPGAASCGTAMGGALHGAILAITGQAQQGVDQIGLQLAHLSPAIGSVVATFDQSLNDAGLVPMDYLNVGPANGVIINRPSAPGAPEWGTQGVSIGAAVDGGVALRMSLADIQHVSDPSLLPSDFFKSGSSYVFVLVGDPAATNALYVDGGLNPKFDGTAVHLVAISTSPVALGDAGF